MKTNPAVAFDVVARSCDELGLLPDAMPEAVGADPRLGQFTRDNASAIAWGVVAWRSGHRWAVCDVCREPALRPRAGAAKRCTMTPRCKGHVVELAKLPAPAGAPPCDRPGCDRLAPFTTIHGDHLCRGCLALAAVLADERTSHA